MYLISNASYLEKCFSHHSARPGAPRIPPDPLEGKPHVSFGENEHAQPDSTNFYEGLGAMSPLLIKQAIREALESGMASELEASRHLTILYGGLLLENATLVEQHRPILGPKIPCVPPLPLFFRRIRLPLSLSLGIHCSHGIIRTTFTHRSTPQ